jgi:4'-phosphopantetheinyl transferase
MIAVEVWAAPLDVDEAALVALERTLSAPEREYARGMIDPLTRRRWLADHGWRRRLLGDLLKIAPEQVAFTVNEHGRPDLAGSPISFSASRSAGGAVYAVSPDATVGVDVEALRDGVDLDAFARRFFSADERAALGATPEPARQWACFQCWTRKEAYAKAAGTGLVFPLSEVEVWAGDDRPVRYGEYEITTLGLGGERTGALAVRATAGDRCQVAVRTLPECFGPPINIM